MIFCNFFEEFFNKEDNILILGDFNIPQFIQNNDNILVHTLNNFCSFMNFIQYNCVKNASNKLLDLVFSNVHCRVEHDCSPVVAEDTHHPALSILIDFTVDNFSNFPSTRPNGVKLYNLKGADFLISGIIKYRLVLSK